MDVKERGILTYSGSTLGPKECFVLQVIPHSTGNTCKTQSVGCPSSRILKGTEIFYLCILNHYCFMTCLILIG